MKRTIALGVGIALAASLGAFWVTRAPRHNGERIFSAELKGNALEVKDASGRLLWRHRYPKPLEAGTYLQLPLGASPTRIADFLNDGKQEIAVGVSLREGLNRADPSESELDFFSEDGLQQWRYVPNESIRFGQYELTPPWILEDMFATTVEEQKKLYVVGAHHTWGNSFIAEVDPRTGKHHIRYVNTGAMYSVNEIKTSAGTFLLAGGFNNEWDGASLAIFNVNKDFAASPQTAGTRHKCESCPAGDPDYYFVFPRSEINRLSDSYNMPVLGTIVGQDGIQVNKYDRMGWGKEATFYLLEREPPFRLKWMRFETNYQTLHRQWSEEGKLDHKYEDCPELRHPKPVKMWTPSAGWTEIEVPGTTAN